MAYERRGFLPGSADRLGEATRPNARSKASRPLSDSSAPSSRAMSMNRLDSAGSSGRDLGLRGGMVR